MSKATSGTTDSVPNPKAGHTGTSAGPFGPHVYLLTRHDGTMISVHPTRHHAAGYLATSGMWYDVQDYDVRRVRVGEVPMEDVRQVMNL
jgi:hypothetical protein